MNPFRWKFDKWPCRISSVWLNTQDPITTQTWRDALSMHLANTTVASEENFTIALSDLQATIDAVPAPMAPSAQALRDWNPGAVTDWQDRMDSNLNISDELGALLGQIQSLQQSRTSPEEIAAVAATVGPLQGTLEHTLVCKTSIILETSSLQCLQKTRRILGKVMDLFSSVWSFQPTLRITKMRNHRRRSGTYRRKGRSIAV